jgi:transposase
MLNFPSAVDIFICTQPTDMRKSFDTLSMCVSQILHQNPLSGHIFVFFNKRRDRMKLLYWDHNGFCLFYKRLERGTFSIYDWNNTSHTSYTTSARELTLILEGIDISRARQLPRYCLSDEEKKAAA